MKNLRELFVSICIIAILSACSNSEEPSPTAVFAGPNGIPTLHPTISSSTGKGVSFAQTYYQNLQDQIEHFSRIFNGPEELTEVEPLDGFLQLKGEIISFRAFQYYDSARDCRKVIHKAITDQGQFFEYFDACHPFGGDTGEFDASWHAFQSHDRKSGYVGHQFADFRRMEWDITDDHVTFSRSWPWVYKFEIDPNDLSGEIKVAGVHTETDKPFVRYISTWNGEGKGSYIQYDQDGSIKEEGQY